LGNVRYCDCDDDIIVISYCIYTVLCTVHCTTKDPIVCPRVMKKHYLVIFRMILNFLRTHREKPARGGINASKLQFQDVNQGLLANFPLIAI
jgi:hypothetical protein